MLIEYNKLLIISRNLWWLLIGEMFCIFCNNGWIDYEFYYILESKIVNNVNNIRIMFLGIDL